MQTNRFNTAIGAVATLALAMGLSPVAVAQGKIVCWKDAAGKVVGCGDKVPLEYVNSGSKELDKRGNVRKTGESADEAAKRKVLEQEQAQAKAEEQKRVSEQKRRDSALMNTFTNEKEIDLKRDRELQAIDNNITQQRAALKLASERLADAQQRAVAFDKGNKDKKATPVGIKDDLTRAENDKGRLDQDIAAKEKSKQDTATTYAAYKKRYQELKGIPSETPEPAAPAPKTAAVPPPAKK